MHILALLRERFAAALDGWVDNYEPYLSLITTARDPQHGDYQANIAMPLKNALGMPPREIAQQIVDRLEVSDICAEPEVAGPGFINLKLKDELLTQQLGTALSDERLGVRAPEVARTYVIDYSSPNVAKPMHVGHIRSTVIGDALTRILRFVGHKVISDNHLGDWGTQFGMIIYGYKNFVDQAAFESSPVEELSRIYRIVQAVIGYQSATSKQAAAQAAIQTAQDAVATAEALPEDDKKRKKQVKAAARSLRTAHENLQEIEGKIAAVRTDAALLEIAEAHPELQTRCQLETVKLHEGDEQNLGLWKQFLDISIVEINAVYERLGIEFDYTLGESFYHPMLADVVAKLQKAGLAVESDGAICVFLEEFDAPMIIQKRDGAFLYSTTDLATIDYRLQEFSPDALLYVVDHRQGEHFEKLFAVGRKMGLEDVELKHVSFGTVLGKDGKPFKTRSGAVIGLEHLLDEAVERAYQVVTSAGEKRTDAPAMGETEMRQVANVVGHGAIKYADLAHNRTSDYEFDLDKMVRLDGNTSAYIQYMVARIKSIIRKSEVDISMANVASFKVTTDHPAERALVLQLLQFEDTLAHCLEDYMPNVLTAYLYSVAKAFASFFDQCPVLKAESEEQRKSRLAICFGAARTLEQGLNLLGIHAVDRM